LMALLSALPAKRSLPLELVICFLGERRRAGA
jgi:hypothetical protein